MLAGEDGRRGLDTNGFCLDLGACIILDTFSFRMFGYICIGVFSSFPASYWVLDIDQYDSRSSLFCSLCCFLNRQHTISLLSLYLGGFQRNLRVSYR